MNTSSTAIAANVPAGQGGGVHRDQRWGSIKVHDLNHPDLPEPLKLFYSPTLMALNDAGFSFVDIANVIEFCLDHPDIAELRPYKTEDT
jgi:hypothetical protein